MSIAASQALGPYTKQIAEIFKERLKSTNFLRSYFPNRVSPTKLVSVFVQRGYEQVAVDCSRGSEGNRNQWTKSSEKIFEPLYFRENFDLTQMQLYDALFSPQLSENAGKLAALLVSIVDMQMDQTAKIERAIEVMCSQILETGVISMSTNGTGIQIDFKRKAASLVNSSVTGPWATGTVSPFDQLQADCDFLRQQGKTASMTFDCIMGQTAIQHFFANTVVTTRQNLFNMSLDTLVPPKASQTTGAVYHGTVSCGPYRVNIWSYPQWYDVVAADGTFTSTAYVNAKKVITMPTNPTFFTFFGAVPQVITPGAMPLVGDFVYSDWVSQEKRSHLYEVESCPLPVPVSVDQIITRQVAV
jgi:hypothetical protein